jgi:hypothetical protein
MNRETPPRLVIFKSETHLVAQLLEVDFAVQAVAADDLVGQLITAMTAEYKRCEAESAPMFSGLPPAPERYWAMWNEAKRLGSDEPAMVYKVAAWLSLGEVRATEDALAAILTPTIPDG